MTDKDDKKKSKPSKEEDHSLWELYTSDIDPLDPDRVALIPDGQIDGKPLKKKVKSKHDLGEIVVAPALQTTIEQPAQIDKRTEMKLKRGQMPIEARIDLHGLYQKDAKAKLSRFIEQSYHTGFRCVLVVTGKGKLILEGEIADERTPGVIRRNFKHWIAEPPLNSMILKAVRAQIKDGGEGAFYVLLRKKR